MDINNQKQSFSYKAICFFTTLFLFVSQLYGQIVMMGTIGIIFLLYAISCRGKIKLCNDQYYKIYMLSFSILCIASSLWAESSHYALQTGLRMLQISIMMFILYPCFEDDTSINSMLKVVMYSGYAISIYVIAVSGLDSILTLVTSAQRISHYQIEELNANTIGQMSAYSILINIYLIFYGNKRVRVTDILLIPGFLTLVASQSRKAFIIVILGVVGLILLRNYCTQTKKQFFFSVLKLFILLVVFVEIMIYLASFPIFSLILDRFLSMKNIGAESASGGLRVTYINLGRDLFFSSPILGVGIDNARVFNAARTGHDVYLHNNFIELLADLGLGGFCIYYSIYAGILYKMIRLRGYRDMEYDICLILLLVKLLIDYGQITYYTKDNAFLTLVFWLEVRKLEKKAYTNTKKESLEGVSTVRN